MTSAPSLIELFSLLDSEARTAYDIFTGASVSTPHGRTFGGQVLGQALAAAGETVSDERTVHSMHGYFLRPGDAEHRMTFEVARLYEGRSFSTRRVQSYQEGTVLMSLIASFQSDEEGPEHHDVRDMSDVPDPDEIPSLWQKYGHLATGPHGSRASWLLNRPFDLRYVEGDILLEVERPEPHMRVWLRSNDTIEAGQTLHSAALAYASDYLLVEPLLKRHNIPWATPGLRIASLDHAMWFHRPFRVDDWLLYDLESPTSQGARGLTHGRFYNRAGELVASVAQECMLRWPGGTGETEAAER